jgi:hypothetical protein
MTFLRHETEPDPERGSLSQQAIGERLRIDRTGAEEWTYRFLTTALAEPVRPEPEG